MSKQIQSFRYECLPSIRSKALALGFSLALGGCGGGMMAPDALVEDPGANAFLTRVSNECADASIGNNQLNRLINVSDDAYFLDLTTKLYFGEVSRDQYRSDIDGFYPTGDNRAGVSCVLSKLPSA